MLFVYVLASVIVSASGIQYTPFLFNGKAMTYGTLCECLYKKALNLPPVKDVSTPFDEGDDIPEFNRSVKAKGFSLTEKPLGDTKQAIIDAYFERVHSSSFAYCIYDIDTKTLKVYVMNAEQFRAMLEKFGTIERSSKKAKTLKVRIKRETDKLLKWLEENAGE